VQAVTPKHVSESLALLIRYQRIPLRDLAEFREGVEGIVAGLAAERAKAENIKKLKRLLNEAKYHFKKGVSNWDEFIEADNKIHMELAHIAANPVYVSVLQMVHDNITRYYNRFLTRDETIMEENYRDLCDIVKAVEEGNAEKAKSLVIDHVKRFNRFMEERSDLAEPQP